MSIAPPSDIILDVAQAGDPLKVQAAMSKLAAAAGQAGAAPASFDDALSSAGAGAGSGGLAKTFNIGAGVALGRVPLESKQVTTDRKFEAMVLQNFIENIMPKDSELFGDKASADMCRTLLSEQLATQMAKSSKLGIAKSIEKFQNTVASGKLPAPLPLDWKASRA